MVPTQPAAASPSRPTSTAPPSNLHAQPSASPSSYYYSSASPSSSSLADQNFMSPMNLTSPNGNGAAVVHPTGMNDDAIYHTAPASPSLRRCASPRSPRAPTAVNPIFVPPSKFSSPRKNTTTATQTPRRASSTPKATSAGILPGAYYALFVLIAMNLLNFADRFVPSACKSLIQEDLKLTDLQTALPFFAFLVIYMVTAPIFGFLADQGHVKRVPLIAVGLFLWSLATVAGAFATNFNQFLLARAAVGVGEAAYATIAPALLCDFFPVKMRPKVLSWFYLAIPVGASIGYGVAGQVGNHYGWRDAFLVCGMPGLVLVPFVLAMREPQRGIQDQDSTIHNSDGSVLLEEDESPINWSETISTLWKNDMYMYALVAVTLCSFASGAIADWLPTWLTRVQLLSIGDAGLIFGLITCIAGVTGSLCGYMIGGALDRAGVRNAYFILGSATQSATCFFASLLLVIGAYATLTQVVLIALACQFALWLNVGGVSAVIANSVHPKIRSRAFGVSILISHLFGDAISPSLVGWVSDEYGDLTMGLSIVPVAFALASIVFAMAARNIYEKNNASILMSSKEIKLELSELPETSAEAEQDFVEWS